MLSTPRSIFFQTELEFLPIDELKLGKNIGRKLYAKMAESDPYAYDNVNIVGDTLTLSTLKGTGQSACQIEPHSICIEERKPEFEVGDFVSIVANILKGLQKIDETYPPIIVQRCKIQCLSQPHKSANSLELLAGKVARVLDKIDPFERSPSFFGVRFRFMPQGLFEAEGNEEGEAAAREQEQKNQGRELAQKSRAGDSFVMMRFETYAQDLSMVWMEVAATYPVLPPIEVANGARIGDNIEQTYRFLTEKGKRFLEQFDQASSDKEKE